MKKSTLFALPFLLLLALAALHVGAEPATQSADTATAVTDATPVEPTIAEVDEASLEWPLRPAFLLSQSLTTCEPCTSHSQCRSVCGGYGACLKDVQTVCGIDPYARFCVC